MPRWGYRVSFAVGTGDSAGLYYAARRGNGSIACFNSHFPSSWVHVSSSWHCIVSVVKKMPAYRCMHWFFLRPVQCYKRFGKQQREYSQFFALPMRNAILRCSGLRRFPRNHLWFPHAPYLMYGHAFVVCIVTITE